LLQKVRVAPRQAENLFQRLGRNFGALVFDGFLDGTACGLRRKRPDFGEIEQTLGVGLRVAHAPSQLRQSRTDQHHRQAHLLGAVHGGDERGELGLLHMLQFVDEDGQRGIGGLGSQPDLLDERLQVVLEVAVVGKARFRVVVDADLDIAETHLELACETRQRAQAANGMVFRRGDLAQAQQGLARSCGASKAGRNALPEPRDARYGCRRLPRLPGYGPAIPSCRRRADPPAWRSSRAARGGLAPGRHAMSRATPLAPPVQEAACRRRERKGCEWGP